MVVVPIFATVTGHDVRKSSIVRGPQGSLAIPLFSSIGTLSVMRLHTQSDLSIPDTVLELRTLREIQRFVSENVAFSPEVTSVVFDLLPDGSGAYLEINAFMESLQAAIAIDDLTFPVFAIGTMQTLSAFKSGEFIYCQLYQLRSSAEHIATALGLDPSAVVTLNSCELLAILEWQYLTHVEHAEGRTMIPIDQFRDYLKIQCDRSNQAKLN